jgi:hypothetical protein
VTLYWSFVATPIVAGRRAHAILRHRVFSTIKQLSIQERSFSRGAARPDR